MAHRPDRAFDANETLSEGDSIGQIIDGRSRYKACKAAGVEPRLCKSDDDGDQSIGFLI